MAGIAKVGQESRRRRRIRRQKTAPKNAEVSVLTDKNSRKKLARVSQPQKPLRVNERERRAGERLRKLNETLTVLFRFAPDAIIIVDKNGCIVRVNEQARAMFGYTAKEFIGNRMEMLMPPRFRKRHVGHQQRFMIEPRLRRMGAGLELYAQRKDGTEFPVDIMLSPIETSEGRIVIATVRDVTEHRRVEETLRRSREELEVRVRERTAELRQANRSALAALGARASQQKAVAELSQRALEGRDLDSLLSDAVSLVPRILQVEFCKVLELLPDGNVLLLRTGAGWKEGYVGHARLPTGKESHGGFTLLSSSPVIVEDFQTETRFHPPSLSLNTGSVAVLA